MNRIEAFPEILYVDYCGNLSPHKGNVKTFKYVLKKVSRDYQYIQELFTLYRMLGISSNSYLPFDTDTITELLKSCDEVIIQYREMSKTNRFCMEDPGRYYDLLAAYRVIGKDVQNPNRVYINQKTKDTLTKREQMTRDVPLLLKVTNEKIVIDKAKLIDQLNIELKKKGYDPLQYLTRIEID